MTAGFPDLVTDETVMWEGRPDTKLRFGMETMATGIFAMALLLACLGMATVIDRSVPGLYWTILAPGLFIAAIVVLIVPWRDSRKRSRTAYRLTNKRAIVQVGRANQSYAIPTPDMLELRGEAPATVSFARLPGNKRISFERIAEAQQVYRMMQELAAART